MAEKYTYVYLGSDIDYYRFNREQMAKDSERVLVCRHIFKNMNWFLRLLFRIHTSKKTNCLFDLPFKKVWSKYFVSKGVKDLLSNKKKICFCISGLEYWYAKNGLVPYLRKQYPFCKVLFFLTDTIDFYQNYYKKFNIEKIKNDFDYVLTYNRLDSNEFGLPIPPPKIISYSCVDDTETEKYDVFFVGRNKGRLDRIIEIADACHKKGLSCYFHIFGVSKEEQVYFEGIHYGNYMPYSDVLKYEKKCRCVLNLYQKNSEGITMRDVEAIGMNKFLLTDGTAVYDSGFYTEYKIINVNNLFEELKKINTINEKKDWNGKSVYTVENYLLWLDKLLID